MIIIVVILILAKKELTKSFQTNSQLNEIKEEIETTKKN